MDHSWASEIEASYDYERFGNYYGNYNAKDLSEHQEPYNPHKYTVKMCNHVAPFQYAF